jgi:hypothetical protein
MPTDASVLSALIPEAKGKSNDWEDESARGPWVRGRPQVGHDSNGAASVTT